MLYANVNELYFAKSGWSGMRLKKRGNTQNEMKKGKRKKQLSYEDSNNDDELNEKTKRKVKRRSCSNEKETSHNDSWQT